MDDNTRLSALEDAVRVMRAAKQAERAVDALLAKIDEDKANAGKPRQGELL